MAFCLAVVLLPLFFWLSSFCLVLLSFLLAFLFIELLLDVLEAPGKFFKLLMLRKLLALFKLETELEWRSGPFEKLLESLFG